jgi:hypothetical protein
MSEDNQLSADADYLSRIDPERYTDLAADALGRITLPALIPGATFRIFDKTQNAVGRQLRKKFVARAGETIDLGDIVIEQSES